jgi:hypothetical protein
LLWVCMHEVRLKVSIANWYISENICLQPHIYMTWHKYYELHLTLII